MSEYFYSYNSPLGEILLGSDGENLTSLKFANLGEFKGQNLQIFKDTSKWLDIYFGGNLPNFTPKISANGSEFARSIWEIALEIPYAKTTTYGEIAHKIATKRQIQKMSSRAVGNALGKNPIALIIPCHRVIASGGKIGGYAYGVEKKIALLNLEKAQFGF